MREESNKYIKERGEMEVKKGVKSCEGRAE